MQISDELYSQEIPTDQEIVDMVKCSGKPNKLLIINSKRKQWTWFYEFDKQYVYCCNCNNFQRKVQFHEAFQGLSRPEQQVLFLMAQLKADEWASNKYQQMS